MDIELLEIRDFLASRHPFNLLPEDELNNLPRSLELSYTRRNQTIYQPHSDNNYLFIIRTGAIEVKDEKNTFLSRRGEGDTFGARSLLRGKTQYHVNAIEDTLLYKLPKYKFRQLCEQHEQFAYYYHADEAQRVRQAVNHSAHTTPQNNINLMALPIKNLLSDKPVMLTPETSIHDAAKKMMENNVSSLLICDKHKLTGIVTERDLCNRCLAVGTDSQTAISTIMTTTPQFISHDDYAFSAFILMSRHNIRHLPVMDNEKVVGVISITDLIQRQATSPVYLVADIYRQNNIEQLAEISTLIPQALTNLVNVDASAHSIGHMISSVGEAITIRLLSLAHQQLGPAPIDYCWLSFGSLARREQLVQSDQDNGLLLSDSYNEKEHGEYFEKLAQFVSDGLHACGYEYCPGNIMASNTKWRQPINQWKKYFDDWINKPEPKALMHASIFFDMRFIHGHKALLKELHRYVLQQSQNNKIFLAHLVGNALHNESPLGFFRRFVLVKDGKHDNTLDLKHNGVVPIIDLARIYALAHGTESITTRSRLEATAGAGEISQQGAIDLRDALEFISMIRLKHQARLIQSGQLANNFIAPDELTNFERNHLKDAFAIVRTIQAALGQRYQSGRF